MGHDFDVPTNIPPHLPTPMGLVHVLFVVALLVFSPVVRENIRGDDLRIVLQETEGAAEANAIGNQVFGYHDADSREAIRPQARQGLLHGQPWLAREIAIGEEAKQVTERLIHLPVSLIRSHMRSMACFENATSFFSPSISIVGFLRK